MKALKRVLAVAVMAMSTIMVLLLLAGIVGTWVANKAVTDAAVQVLTGVDTGLGRTEQALTRLGGAAGNARDRVAAFDERVASAGENFVENPVLLNAIVEELDLDIGPAVEEVRAAVQTIRETALAVQNVIQALNELPFVSIGGSVAEEDRLQKLSDGVASLAEGVQEIRDDIREAKAEASTAVVTAIGRGTSRLDTGLENIETALSGYEAQVSALRTQVTDLTSALVFWLDAASVVISLALLWLIFAHMVTFVFGLSLYRGKNLFAAWMGDPAQPPAVATGLTQGEADNAAPRAATDWLAESSTENDRGDERKVTLDTP